MSSLLDPRVFNVIIIALYAINAGWWAYHHKWGDVWYWSGALVITSAVTWGYKH